MVISHQCLESLCCTNAGMSLRAVRCCELMSLGLGSRQLSSRLVSVGFKSRQLPMFGDSVGHDSPSFFGGFV